MCKQVKYGPYLKDGRRAVHWRYEKDNDFSWKHVGWVMPAVTHAQAKRHVDRILGEYLDKE